MDPYEIRMKALDRLEETVRSDASGDELPAPEREFFLRYVIGHASDTSIQRLWEAYAAKFLSEEDE